MVERTIELICFNHHKGTLRVDEVVSAVVLSNTTEKSVTSHMALIEQVSCHGCCGGFSMCSSHTESFHLLRQSAEHLGALMYLKSILAKPHKFFVFGRNGRCVNHQCCLRVATFGREVDILLLVDLGALFAEPFCKFGGRSVITANENSIVKKIALQGAHADAACTDEIY